MPNARKKDTTSVALGFAVGQEPVKITKRLTLEKKF